MRTRFAFALMFAATAIVPAASAVTIDPQPDINNVLLLVDTSGSMSYKSSSEDFPICLPTTGGASERSRWIEVIESLTGSIEDYRCFSQGRNTEEFRQEFTYGGIDPYDFEYLNPYSRPMSGLCVPGPGTLGSNVFSFPASAIKFHQYDSVSTLCSNFQQAGDGLLDAFRAGTRFALMTFDTLGDAGLGYSGTLADPPSGFEGGWSYYVPSRSQGKPAACQALQDLEVGVRNAAAPPWEGRLIPFGDPFSSEATMLQTNQEIQQVLLASRPFGATPIAGMMHDAREFLWNDTQDDPRNSTQKFGPRDDQFIADGCRRTVILLLTDGEPNTDLRPECEGVAGPSPDDDGVCPFQRPEDIAYDLFNPSGIHASRPPVETHVIGFALPSVTVGGVEVDCKNLTSFDLLDPNGVCQLNPSNKPLQACCTLDRIAYNGWEGSQGEHKTAYFVSSHEELRLAIQKVLAGVASTNSRTQPATASGMSAAGGVNGTYRFFSSFVPTSVDLWPGVLERQRIECETDQDGERVPVIQDFDPQKGDDFIANVNASPPGDRLIYTVIGEAVGNQVFSQRSIRTFLSIDDGAGQYIGSPVRQLAQNLPQLIPPQAMSLGASSCTNLTPTDCRDLYMNWELGLNNTSRCPVPGDPVQCKLISAIFHSTPVPVGRPASFVRDESYQRFAVEQRLRPLMLYTSTTDGMLHAFKVAPGDPGPADPPVDSMTSNELWAFIPPAILPSIAAQYPAIHQQLLDATPVVAEVPAILQGGLYHFRRTAVEAEKDDNVTEGAPIPTWRTVLVQGFGPQRGGYFAMDITEPVPDLNDPTVGPRFLWQLTSTVDGTPLFGQSSGMPAVTTLSVDADGDGNPTDIAVAVLPGGNGGSPEGSCTRINDTPTNIDSAFPPRQEVPCYPTAGAARSVSIVKLDTGEIIRTFRQTIAEVPEPLQVRTTATEMDSPMVGQPVPYPAGPGAVADRIFIGDRDGTLWKIDVSKINPAEWTMSMFFDLYPDASHDYDDGQPIVTRPIVSIDPLGSVTLAVATGDQEVLVATPGMDNYVWSLKEIVNSDGSGYHSEAQWYTKFGGGERVTGPLTLFNSRLFFASYLPQPDDESPCSLGNTTVWGVHYILPEETDISQGGLAQFVDPNEPSILKQSVNASALLGDPDQRASIFGIAVAQKPTCNITDEDFGDPYLGYKSHTSVNTLNPGEFELVMHTGRAGQGIQGGGATKVLTVDLPAPMQPARADSWAAIVE